MLVGNVWKEQKRPVVPPTSVGRQRQECVDVKEKRTHLTVLRGAKGARFMLTVDESYVRNWS